jgi:hypothetical protein
MCEDCGCGCECNCDGSCECHRHEGRFVRQYQTRAEQISELESYLAELKLEVQAVEEHLADLQRTN